AGGSAGTGGMDQFKRMATAVSAFLSRECGVRPRVRTPPAGGWQRRLLLRKSIRRALHRSSGLDGRNRIVRTAVGFAKPRDASGPALEESSSTARHAGAFVA